MKFGLIVIANEILSGRTQDLNIQALAAILKKKGHRLSKVSIIGDKVDDIQNTIEIFLNECDVVVTCGGLGPTKDDLTKEAFCRVLKTSLQENEEVAQMVLQHYQAFGRQWNPHLNHYHYFPKGAIPLKNPQGLAPGLLAFISNKALISAPGVPREFYSMIRDVALQHLEDHHFLNAGSLYSITLRSLKIPEEMIFGQMCPDLWEQLSHWGEVSSLPHLFGVDLVVTIDTGLHDWIVAQKEIIKLISSTALKNHIWQIGDQDFPQYLVEHSLKKGLSFAVAESCTGGLVCDLITNNAGSSRCFKGGVISYSNEIKQNMLGVLPSTLQTYGAVSEETAKEMALGIKNKTGADLGLSITGIAGPDGATTDKPVGTVCIAVANQKEVKSFTHYLKGDRVTLKKRFAQSCLYHLMDSGELKYSWNELINDFF